MRKWFAILSLVLAFVLVLGACSSGNSGSSSSGTSASSGGDSGSSGGSGGSGDGGSGVDGKKLTFAYSIMVMDNPYFIAVKQGFEDRAKELGITTIVNDAKYDAATQISQVENYITQKVDAIAISPIDSKGLESVVERAKEAGIIVVGEAQPVENAHGNYIVNEYEFGYLNGSNVAKWINEKLGGEAEVLIIAQDNVEAVKRRGDGLEDAIKEFAPNAKIVARQTGDTPELGMKIAETVLQSHPNLKVIAGTNDSGALGAYEAVMAMNRATPDFYVGGADATAEALAKMKEENSVYRFTIDIDPYGTGRRLVDMMLEYVQEGPKNETRYFDMTPVWQDELQ